MARLKTLSQSIKESVIPRNSLSLMNNIRKSLSEIEIVTTDYEQTEEDYGFTFSDDNETHEVKFNFNSGKINMYQSDELVVEDIEDVEIVLGFLLG